MICIRLAAIDDLFTFGHLEDQAFRIKIVMPRRSFECRADAGLGAIDGVGHEIDAQHGSGAVRCHQAQPGRQTDGGHAGRLIEEIAIVAFDLPISMAFQPIVDTQNHRVFAYEALVRGRTGHRRVRCSNRSTATIAISSSGGPRDRHPSGGRVGPDGI